MHFDLTVRLGDLLIAVGFLGGSYVFYGRFTTMESKIDALWNWWMDNVSIVQHEPVRVKHKAHD